MQTLKIPLANIKIGPRQRTDYGDIEDLADSLDRYGLIQPVVLDNENNLIAGGRRIAAATLLEWPDINVVYLGSLTDDERAELELEENVRRKDMDWRERVLAIAQIHEKKSLNGMLSATKWGLRETGELLGVSHSNVQYALWAADQIKKNDPAVKACNNMHEVVKVMLQRKEDETLSVMASEPSHDVPQHTPAVENSLEPQDAKPHVSVQLRCFFNDALRSMELLHNSVDHIVTDPPYGIDMDNLQQDNVGMNVERTAKEHVVKDNLTLLQHFLAGAFRTVRNNGFCVFWCDQDNWNALSLWAQDVGWRVQRWPLVWVKTDPCQNCCAQFNFTKKTEIAMVLRKPNATLNAVQSTNVFVGSGEDKKLFSHPFAKPRDLHKWIINAVSQPGQTILDPFAGSGTCPVACIEMGRNPIAVELVEHHYNECLENMKRAYRSIHGPEVRFV